MLWLQNGHSLQGRETFGKRIACNGYASISGMYLTRRIETMKLKKDSYIYENSERVANGIKATAVKTGKPARNLAQQDTATIALWTVLQEVEDALAKGIVITDPDNSEAKAWRIEIRNEIQPLFTASKNYQGVVMADTGLMEKPAAVRDDMEDFA